MGTKIKMLAPNPGVEFRFDDDDAESGRIWIRPLNQAKRQEIQRECIKRRDIYRNGQRYEVTDTDDEKMSRLIWDYSIERWDGLEDEEGNPIECNPENKAKLMLENVGFALFVGTCLERVHMDMEARVEAAEKN
jgi:hypothetical protein